RQIAANIIDYSDNDRDATRDSLTNPTYWGLEKVPYISRLQFRLTNTSVLTNASQNRYRPRLQVEVKPELINMHGNISSYSTVAHIQVVANIQYRNARNTALTT